MKIVMSGATGFVGQSLVPALRAAGHEVRMLVRRPAERPDEIFWQPELGYVEPAEIEGADAIINLAGENIAARRWSVARRERILRSRVEATRTLVVALDGLRRKPALFLSASAVGYYGERGDEVLRETSAIGHGFLPEVCLAWETHAEGAARKGVRTALLRFGTVLGHQGGALAKMLPVFRLGLGGRLGDGQQWMSWIALEDLTAAILHLLTAPDVQGPVNLVAPHPVRNVDFTRILAGVLRRPAVIPAPGWVLRLAFGQLADEALLASTRVEPARLLGAGFRFSHPELESALRSLRRGDD